MAPEVSVVMITYRHAKYIGFAVESCLKQTLQSIEVIVVDDGSDDETTEILQRYRDSRLVAVRQENAGPSSALNRAMAIARGQYIAVMSGDDVCLLNRLERQLASMKDENLDAIFGRPALIDEDGLELPDSRASVFFRTSPRSSSELFHALFFEGNFLCAPSAMIRKAAIADCGVFHPALYQLQDFEMWLRLCRRHRVRLSDDRVISYRLRDGGGNLSSGINQRRTEVELSWIYGRLLADLEPDVLRKAFADDLAFWGLVNTVVDDQRIMMFLLHPSSLVRRRGFELLIDRFSQSEQAVVFAGLTIHARDLAGILLANA
jgi:glycosyltransferase involved in cell wall biosynthesis